LKLKIYIYFDERYTSMKTKTIRRSATKTKGNCEPRPDHGLLRRMKDRVQSMPFEMSLFEIVRELENQETVYDSAKILGKIRDADTAVSFLYLCAVNSNDNDFKALVIDVLNKIEKKEARQAADDILARKTKDVHRG
jgi:hypothetical protein